MFEIRHYITDDGRDVYADWRDEVKDIKAKIAIVTDACTASSWAISVTTSHAEMVCGSFASTQG
jgi:hypothetical protein